MKKLFIPFVLLLLLTDSCKKKEDNNGTTGNTTVYKTYGSMDEIYAELSLKPKAVTFDAATGSKFYGNSGTQYVFQPNCFQDATGASVTGTVRVEVTEWMKKGDMIFSKMLPISNEQPLMSAGEIYVQATQGGQEIFLKPGFQFQANIPQGGPVDSAMIVFRGNTYDPSGPSAGVTNVNWVPGKTDSSVGASIVFNNDTVKIFADSLKFYNGDHYLTGVPTTNSTKLTVSTNGGTLAPEKMQAYMLVDGKRSLWPIRDQSFLAINQPCHIVAYGLIDGRFYAGTVAIVANTTPGIMNSFSLLMTEVKPEDFKAQLNVLY